LRWLENEFVDGDADGDAPRAVGVTEAEIECHGGGIIEKIAISKYETGAGV